MFFVYLLNTIFKIGTSHEIISASENFVYPSGKYDYRETLI